MNQKTGDPEMARDVNKALILKLLRSVNIISRAEISRKLNLGKVTVSTIVNELIKDNLVVELGKGESLKVGGRKPVLLSLNNSDKFVIGVDIGTTSIVVAIGNIKGEVLYKTRNPTTRNRSVENIVDQVTYLIDEVIKKSSFKKDSIIGLGISAAGTVEKHKGLISVSPDFNWRNVYITKMLEEKTGLPITVDNCTRAMTLGEKWYGGAKDVRNLFYVNVGYGIGSAMIIEGKIYNNHSEFGHCFVTDENVWCSCGKYGCLEAVASGNAIENIANESLDTKSESWISAKMVADLAIKGDTTAKEIFNKAGKYLGQAISMVANLFNPDKIIIGGGVALAKDLILEPVLVEYERNTMDVIKDDTKIEISTLGMDAGVLGAIALALNKFIFKPGIINSS
jgi:glucokinase-like ROK family protein